MEAITRTRIYVKPQDVVSTDAGHREPRHEYFVSAGTVVRVSALATSGDAHTILRHNGVSFRIASESLIEIIECSLHPSERLNRIPVNNHR